MITQDYHKFQILSPYRIHQPHFGQKRLWLLTENRYVSCVIVDVWQQYWG